jgi:GT2 family glycosyltransferase
MEGTVAVVILNFNGVKLLEKFLPNVIHHSYKHCVYVADNASNDGSVEFIKNHFPEVKIIVNQKNGGYAGGYNKALKLIDAKYYVLLNNDVDIKMDWLTPIVQLFEKNEQIAACQPKILDYNKPAFFEYAGASGGFIDKFGYPFCRGRVFNTLEEDKGQFNDETEIFWASGACMFVRAEAFWKVGGLDDDYFAHMEEIDLCWRFKNAGYKIFVEPKSVVYHVGGGTLNKISATKTFLNFRNNLATLIKNHPSQFMFFKIFFRLNLDGVAAFKFLFDGQPAHFFAVLRSHGAFYRWLPKNLNKRKQLKKMNGYQFSLHNAFTGNLVTAYFLKKIKTFSKLYHRS